MRVCTVDATGSRPCVNAGDPVVAGGLIYWPFEDARFSAGRGNLWSPRGGSGGCWPKGRCSMFMQRQVGARRCLRRLWRGVADCSAATAGKKLAHHSRPPDARAASQPIHESRLARRHTLRWPRESYAGGQQAVSRRGRYRRRRRGLAGRPANGHVARARRLDLCGQRPRREPRCMEDGRRKHRTGHRARWRFGARVRVRSSACLGRVGGAGAGALWRSDEGARHSVPMI